MWWKMGLLPQPWRLEIVARSLSTCQSHRLKNLFGRKVMLCVRWNFEGVIHWEFVPSGHAVIADVYSQQLERVHEILRLWYPALVNWNGVLKTAVTKILELREIELLPHPAYSPDLVPSDYHLFQSMAHFVAWKKFKKHWRRRSRFHWILRIKNQRLVPSKDNKPLWKMAQDHRIWWSLLWRVV